MSRRAEPTATLEAQSSFVADWNAYALLRQLAASRKWPALAGIVGAGRDRWRRFLLSAPDVEHYRALRALGASAPDARPMSAEPVERAPSAPSAVIKRGVVGVLTDPAGVRHVGDALDIALDADVEQLWISPAPARRIGLDPAGEPADESARWLTDARSTHDVRATKSRGWFHGWRRAERARAADVIVGGWDSTPIGRLDAPEDTATALELVAGALGIVYRRSGGTTGTDLLKQVSAGRIRRSPIPSAPHPRPEHREADYFWLRGLAEPERDALYVHAYDVNGMHIAACSSVACGTGDADHLVPTRAMGARLDAPAVLDFDRRLPGYWRAMVRHDADPLLPNNAVVGATGRAPADRWYSTPTLALLVEMGADVECLEAWAWRRSTRALTPWYERLRDALYELRDAPGPAGKAARDTVKLTAYIALGWFEAYFREPGDALYRPHWRHAAVATARANLFRHLRRIAATSGRRPFAIYHDCCYFTADDADPVAGRPAGLELSAKLGRFKVEGSAAMSDVAPLLGAHPSAALNALRDVLK